tara:strand:+ start:1409 stop:1588 length:180 start_codon:yes stop_codon:yes gene_type:complete
MGLKSTCPHCANRTIPKRIVGVYIGAPNSIKIWECRDCFGLWSDNYQKRKIGDVSASSI